MAGPAEPPHRSGDGAATSGWGDRASLGVAVLFLGTLAALVVVCGESPGLPWMNHDAANALYVGCRLLEGDVLYVDWAYYVMPPVVFLSAAVCGTAQLTGLSPPSVLHLLLLASAALGLRVLRQAFPGPAARSAGLLLAYLGLVAAGLPFLDRGGYLPAAFGQREHLFTLLFVPYVFWRGSGRPASAAVCALLGFLGFTMMVKPHLVAAVVAVELVCLREPGRRAVWVSLALGSLLPFAALLVHSPEAFGAFFSRAIPYHLGDAYDVYGHDFDEFFWSLRHAEVLALIAGVLGAGGWAVHRGLAPRRLVGCAGAALLVLYLGFLQQGKFFFYHLIPTASLAFSACVALLWWLVAGAETKSLRRAGLALLTLPLLASLGVDLYGLQRQLRESPTGRAGSVLPALANRRFVALISPSVEGAIFRYALVHDLELMGPWTSHYLIPSMLRIEDPVERREAFGRYFAPIAARIRDEAPELILFSPARAQRAMGDRHIHEVFQEMGLLPIAGYRPLRGLWKDWIVYERIPAQAVGEAAKRPRRKRGR